jgi:hypothetical protein
MEAKVRRAPPSGRSTLKDKLSWLTFLEAAKLLGPEGKRVILSFYPKSWPPAAV